MRRVQRRGNRHVSLWFQFHPEVCAMYHMASLASAPAALLLALYGMVGQRERQTLFPARPSAASRRLKAVEISRLIAA